MTILSALRLLWLMSARRSLCARSSSAACSRSASKPATASESRVAAGRSSAMASQRLPVAASTSISSRSMRYEAMLSPGSDRKTAAARSARSMARSDIGALSSHSLPRHDMRQSAVSVERHIAASSAMRASESCPSHWAGLRRRKSTIVQSFIAFSIYCLRFASLYPGQTGAVPPWRCMPCRAWAACRGRP